MPVQALQSPALQRAAQRELDRMEAEQRRIEQRLEAVENERARLRDELRVLGTQAALLNEVLGGGRTVGRAETSAGVVLRGKRLREEAAKVLLKRAGPNTPVHYGTWHDWMTEEGFVVLGKRPKSTFLTGATRSVLVRRGDEPGTYYIDQQVLRDVERELSEKRAELADVDEVLAREQKPSGIRQHRVALLATIRRLENQLAEGQRVIAEVRGPRQADIRAA